MTVHRISPVDVPRDTNPAPLLIDVRTPAEFRAAHAIGAHAMPLDTLDPQAVAALRSSDREPIYLLCQSGGRAQRAGEQLEAAGLTNIWVVDGGTTAWISAGQPVVRVASGVISLERQVRIAAGGLVLIGLMLAWLVHPAFAGLTAFVGAGLVFAGMTDFCGMGMLLARLPWNQRN